MFVWPDSMWSQGHTQWRTSIVIWHSHAFAEDIPQPDADSVSWVVSMEPHVPYFTQVRTVRERNWSTPVWVPGQERFGVFGSWAGRIRARYVLPRGSPDLGGFVGLAEERNDHAAMADGSGKKTCRNGNPRMNGCGCCWAICQEAKPSEVKAIQTTGFQRPHPEVVPCSLPMLEFEPWAASNVMETRAIVERTWNNAGCCTVLLAFQLSLGWAFCFGCSIQSVSESDVWQRLVNFGRRIFFPRTP